MRQLAETERLLVEKIVQLKQAARLEELQVARLLRKELECFEEKLFSSSRFSVSHRRT